VQSIGHRPALPSLLPRWPQGNDADAERRAGEGPAKKIDAVFVTSGGSGLRGPL